MKEIMTIAIFLISYLTIAQVNAIPETELENLAENYLDKYYDTYSEKDSITTNGYKRKAYENFSLLINNFPNSEKQSYYLYSKGCITSDKKESKICFEKVVERNDWTYYTRQSYLILASYAIDDKNFEKALQYLDEEKNLKKPTFTCGNEMETYEAKLKNLYKCCEEGMKK